MVRPSNTEATWWHYTSHTLEALLRNYKPALVHFEGDASLTLMTSKQVNP